MEALKNLAIFNHTFPVRLGIDFGGVIIQNGPVCGHPDKISEDPRYLDRPAIPGAFESIAKLVRLFGPQDIFIVSRCSEAGEQKIRNWLYYKSFWEQTRMLRENIRFCRHRHEKGPICKELNIDYFVDDRFECLLGMDSVSHRYRLSNESPDVEMEHLYTRQGIPYYGKKDGPDSPIANCTHWELIREDIAACLK
ncbi:MAG: hypothetical protein RLZZ347_708 [Candidatus Parcubacteria bacterium]|jgi:hypothetical protein